MQQTSHQQTEGKQMASELTILKVFESSLESISTKLADNGDELERSHSKMSDLDSEAAENRRKAFEAYHAASRAIDEAINQISLLKELRAHE